MTGCIPSLPGLGSSNGTLRSSTRNPHPPIVTADTLSAETLGEDQFYGSSASTPAESGWWGRAKGMLRSVGESLRLIDPAPKQDPFGGDSFETS